VASGGRDHSGHGHDHGHVYDHVYDHDHDLMCL
jgi:hypothetical protein